MTLLHFLTFWGLFFISSCVCLSITQRKITMNSKEDYFTKARSNAIACLAQIIPSIIFLGVFNKQGTIGVDLIMRSTGYGGVVTRRVGWKRKNKFKLFYKIIIYTCNRQAKLTIAILLSLMFQSQICKEWLNIGKIVWKYGPILFCIVPKFS